MKVSAINSRINFGRALNSEEMKEFCSVRDEAKNLAGQTGKSIFIVHDACLPQTASLNTGVSNLSYKNSQEFFAYMKSYLGFNTVEILPQGEVFSNKGFYCAYSGSALSLGIHQINPELLTHEEFGNLLTADEVNKIVLSNNSSDKNSIVNYKNVMDDNSPQDIALAKAYKRFKKLPENHPLKAEFLKFTAENNDWLEPKGIYKILAIQNKHWDYNQWENETDRRLYDSSFDKTKRTARIKQIVTENPDSINFIKFKQFLADKHLAAGRENLNQIGIKLIGDCEIGFSKDEVWAHPEAFAKDCFVGDKSWGLPCLDYDTLGNPDSESTKLLKRKVQLNARRYDGIRFDVGWAYVKPRIFKPDGTIQTLYLKDKILDFIENSVKEIKGTDYDLKNLIYEFDGGDIWTQSGELLPPIKKRVKIFGSTFIHDYPDDKWGSNDAFLKRGWSPDEFIIGVGNHDPQPLRQIANNIPDNAMPEGNKFHKKDAIKALAKILGLDERSLEDPLEFARAKWAEPMMAKNNQMFYMDVFGREERFDMQGDNCRVHPERNYAYKIPENYKDAYHKAVQEGFGFNIMDSLEKVFKAKGLDKSKPELYSKIVKYRNILYEKDNNSTLQNSKNTTKPLTKNKFLKPVLICGIAIAAISSAIIILFKIKNNKKDMPPSQIKSMEKTFYGFNFQNFINSKNYN